MSIPLRMGAAGLVLVLAFVLRAAAVDPVPTWFYVFAWYPTLVVLDAAACALDRRPSLLGDPARLFSLLAWSAVVWLVFEAANLRLANWYYVGVPAARGERWTGILVSFATVVPAIVLAERLLNAAGVFRRGRGPAVHVRPGDLRLAGVVGLGMGLACLAWPERFFPLVWGAAVLLAEPVVYHRRAELSLFRDLERGDWGRSGRLLLGGLGIGFLWELYNHFAGGSWVYSVPGIEGPRLFEMPLPGYLGFPVFALEAWAMYAALVAVGVAVPPHGAGRLHRRRTVVAGGMAALFAAAVLIGMERGTIRSTTAGPIGPSPTADTSPIR